MPRTNRTTAPPPDTIWEVPDSLWPTREAILHEKYPPPAPAAHAGACDGC
jgi:hypothetical protein